MPTTIDLTALAADGDTLDLADGSTLRLRIDPDLDTTILDMDCYGTFAEVRRGAYSHHDAPRPRGFDGRARKLRFGRSYDAIWWQPHPDDLITDADRAAEAQRIIRLLEDGFVTVTVERCQGADAYGRPIVIAVASLGGIEACADEDYLAEIVSDLAHDLL